ncbi:MAG: cupin domain-containing protein [Halobacteriota archaeon]
MRSSKAELPVTYEQDGVIFREAVWGAMHVEIDTFDTEFDFAPLLKDLPDDMCPTSHWGYVFKGRLHVQYVDHGEDFTAGDIFYAEPRHIAQVEGGTEFMMFSPEAEEHEGAPLKLRQLAAMVQVH